MTANTSPRLGLMLPTITDEFDPVDYVNTFTKLDNAPGISLVANRQALPSNLTAAQHGSCYLELDNGALWYWAQPSSGTPGAWKRGNSVGVLGSASQTTDISTTAVTSAAEPTLMTKTVTAPGGRDLLILVSLRALTNSSSAGVTVASLFINGSVVFETSTLSGVFNSAQIYFARRFTPVAGTSYAFRVGIRVGNGPGAGGTSTSAAPSDLTIVEV